MTFEERLASVTAQNLQAIVVGTANIDVIVPGGIPDEGSRPERGIRMALGGGGAITAVQLSKYGLPSKLVSQIGSPGENAPLKHYFDGTGVELRCAERGALPISVVNQHPDGRDTYATNKVYVLEDFSSKDLETLLKNGIGPGSAVLRAGYCHMPNIVGEPTRELFEYTLRKGGISMLDMSAPGKSWGNGRLDELIELILPCTDVVFGNAEELRMLATGQNESPQNQLRLVDAIVYAQKILSSSKYGPNVVAIHGADEGSAVVAKSLEGGVVAVPPLLVKNIEPDSSFWNPTGTGNAWNATFIAYLMEGNSLLDAARASNTAAGLRLSGRSKYQISTRESVDEHAHDRYLGAARPLRAAGGKYE